MLDIMHIPPRLRVRRALDRPQRDRRLTNEGDPLGPSKGLLLAAVLASAIWAVIGLLVWWIVG